MAWVGQHAKAGTPFAHIAHTQWFDVLDWRIDGISVGELGQLAFCAVPFRVEVRYRPDGSKAAYAAVGEHPSDLTACMNAPFKRVEGG